MKTYTTLEEALRDIQFENGEHQRIELFLDIHKEHVQKPLDDMITWMIDALDLKSGREQAKNIVYILIDLASNAYRHGVTDSRDSCSVEAYIGNKGVLMGTRQNKDFLTAEQLTLLKEGRMVPSTRDESNNRGTERFAREGNGILILEQERAIYVAKYYL